MAFAHPDAASDAVTLSVGGTLFETTRSTLTSVPDSVFARWFGRDESGGALLAADARGIFRIDRPPEPFPYILDFLRCGGDDSLTVLPGLGTPDASNLLRLLAREADFYALPVLAAAVRAHADAPLGGALRFAAEDGLVVLSAGGARLETSRATLARAPRLAASLERAPQSVEADASGALRVVFHLDEDATLVTAVLRFCRYSTQGSGRGSFIVAHAAAKDKQMATAAAHLAEKWGVTGLWENAFGELA